MEVVAEGWRTGPTATLLVIVIEYAKSMFASRAWRGLVHVVLGWLLFPLRYLDLLFFRRTGAQRIGNHAATSGFGSRPLRTALLEQFGDQPSPPGLMTRADARSVVTVEVFVEQQRSRK